MNTRTNSPIGVFDSGLGGLTVVKQLLARLPHQSIIYLGDIAHVPYGEKPFSEIRSYALGITDFLIRRNSRLVVMACNMSSATALTAARETFGPVPVIGVIDAGARAAVKASKGGPMGVLATTGTVKTGAYSRTLRILKPGVRVIEQACPRFVPLVESGLADSPDAEEAAAEYVKPLLEAGCDTIILGCTHYPFVIEAVRKAAGGHIEIVDPSEETAAEAAEVLAGMGAASAEEQPAHAFFTTARPEKFAELGERFLGRRIDSLQTLTWDTELRPIEWQETTAEQTTNSVL